MKPSILVGVVGLAIAPFAVSPALACPPMQTVFLIDQSSSMNGNGSSGQPKWQIARDKAFNDFNNLTTGTLVAVAGFENAPRGTPYYNPIVDLADGMVKGVNDAFLLGAIADAFADHGRNTPLAGAVCDGLQTIWTFRPGGDPTCSTTTKRNLYLYSDGLENSTPTNHLCYSATRSTTAYDTTKVGVGFGLTAGSWERKVANMAYNGNPNLDLIAMPDFLRPVMNVTLLFDFVSFASLEEKAASEKASWEDAPIRAQIDDNALAFFRGMSTVSFGTYFEARQVPGGGTAVIPVPGDTDPTTTRSCVEQSDLDRILVVFGLPVTNTNPNFTGAELARRDVTNDLVIDIADYALAIQNFGVCRTSGVPVPVPQSAPAP